jgi:uncharacterized phiE125 gp8 family phage protein
MTLYDRPSVRTVAPTETPVSATEVKRHLRIDHTDDDTLISALIQAATDHVEDHLGVAIVSQTWRHSFGSYGDYHLRLPLPGASSVVFKYDDESGVEQTLSSTQYQVVEDRVGSVIIPAPQFLWPATDDTATPIRITAVHGYADASSVPQAIKHAMLLIIGDWYEHRETVGPNNVATLPLSVTVSALLSPYRRSWIAA